MKVILLLVGIVAMGTGEPVFDNCPDTFQNLPSMKAINTNHIVGIWYYTRKGPIPNHENGPHTIDCVSSVIWKEAGGSDNVFNHLFQLRKGPQMYVAKSNQFTLAPAEDGLYENNFSFDTSYETKKINIQEKLVETDGGRSWSLWASCVTKEPGNSTVMWSIKSRFPRMDPRVEQMVVEKVEKYGGVGPTQLRGVGQFHCHD